MTKHPDSMVKKWQQVEGEPLGVEYAVEDGLVAVRIFEVAPIEHGPAALIGNNVVTTVSALLREMRSTS